MDNIPQYINTYANLGEPCVPFVFKEQEETVVRDSNISKLMDFLVYYILPDSNPRLKIALLTYAAGYDVGRILGCENTQRDISKVLNVNQPTTPHRKQ